MPDTEENERGGRSVYYSAIGILAILVMLIESHDILLNPKDALKRPAWKVYRRFLFAVLAFWRHRSNIVRLLNGTESRFAKEKK